MLRLFFACVTLALAMNLNAQQMGQVKDIKGNEYKTITIGSQEWMAENLRTTKYNNGTAIPNITDNSEWSNLETGAYCWHENDENMAETYGALYNWYAVEAGNLCPAGWRVPTDEDWKELEIYLGVSEEELDSRRRGENKGPLLAGNADLWRSGVLTDDPGFGKTGFLALPGGSRMANGHYTLIEISGYWWSSTDYYHDWEGVYYAYARSIGARQTYIIRDNTASFNRGMSVRCVRDID